MMRNKLTIYLLILIAITLTGCGGGSSGSNVGGANADLPLTVKLDSTSGGIDHGAINVSLSPSIVLNFSDKINPCTVNATTVFLSKSASTLNTHDNSKISNIVEISNFTPNYNNTKFHFSPRKRLEPNTKYYIIITNKVVSISGKAVSSETIFNFTTSIQSLPTVNIITPENNAIGVSLNPSIQLKFSEKVLNVTVNTVSLREYSESGSTVPIESITAGDNNIYTFSSSSELKPSTLYYVVLTDGITDTTGNKLDASKFSFNTEQETWKAIGNVGFSPDEALHVSLKIAPDGTPYVAYTNYGDFNKVRVMKFMDGKWVYPGNNHGFEADQNSSLSLAISPNGTPYVAYIDMGNTGVTVKKFNGINWVNVGVPRFSGKESTRVSLAIAPTGEPYVAITEYKAHQHFRIMKFNGINWENVGPSGVFAGEIFATGLAIAADGSPFVAYKDSRNNYKSSVMKYATDWRFVGNTGIYAGPAQDISLAITKNGTLYIGYQDQGNNAAVTVRKFDGSNWINVGNLGSATESSGYISLAIEPSSNTPYVAFHSAEFGLKTSVIKYTGNGATGWKNVGFSSGFSAGATKYISLAISPKGIPYVAYQDQKNNNKATVMAFIK
jgi:hypothetical protein